MPEILTSSHFDMNGLNTVKQRVQVAPGIEFTLVCDRDSDDPVTSHYLAGHVYHHNLLSFMLGVVKAGQVVLDCGAHIGTFALTAAAAGCRVIAVEADPRNAELLRRSAEENRFTNLTVLNVAAAETAGVIEFACKGPWGFSGGADSGLPVARVQAVILDNVVAELGIRQVDFVKIDVEGFEVHVVRGLKGTLRQSNLPPVVYESNGLGLQRFGFTPGDIAREFSALGYHVYDVSGTDGHTLLPHGPEHVQADNCIDCMALRNGIPALPYWRIAEPVAPAQTALHFATMLQPSAHFSYRSWALQSLRHAPADFLGQLCIIESLYAAAMDASREIRQLASWWTPEKSKEAVLKRPGLKIMHTGSWRGACGIGDYSAGLVHELERAGGLAQFFFPIRPMKLRYFTPTEANRFYNRMRSLFKGFDLVHIQHEFSFFAPSGAFPASTRRFSGVLRELRRLRIPAVITFHTEPDFTFHEPAWRARVKALLRRGWWRWYVARYFRGRKGCHAIVHTSKSRKQLVLSGFADKNVHIIPMGYPARRGYELTREEAKSRLGYPPNAVVLTIFGFVASYKGHVWAAQALRQLPPHYHLAVIGGGHPDSQGDSTLDQALWTMNRRSRRQRRLSIEEMDRFAGRLRVTGYLEPGMIDVYHSACDICLAPYLPANLSASAAVTWALTSGRPTIGSRIPAFQEINELGECMLLVTPGAVQELVWQIKRLAGDPALQEKLVENASRYAYENRWETVAGELASLYMKLASTK